MEEEKYKYKLAQSSAFKKDMKFLSEDERRETKEVIRKLAKGEALDEKYHDHQLSGKLKDFRDCQNGGTRCSLKNLFLWWKTIRLQTLAFST